jgi:hypothetical protein
MKCQTFIHIENINKIITYADDIEKWYLMFWSASLN